VTHTDADSSSGVLAAFAAAVDFGSIPADVIDHAKVCLLDTIGCGLFGSTLPWARIAYDTAVAACGGQGNVVVWGRAGRLQAADSALVNGTAVHAFELDDLHPRSIVHPGSVVTTAAWAVAADRPALSGAQLLAAVVVGYEIAARVGLSVGAAHLLAGWHPTGTHGTLGAAAAAGHVLGLDRVQLREALGIAGSQSAGLMAAQYESMVKRLHAGRAASNGVWSAQLAARGFTGIRDLFEADYGGYGTTFSPRFDPAPLTSGLGDKWETLRVGFKPYSANGSCHPSVDCLRALRERYGIAAADVADVEIEVSTATVRHVGWPYRLGSITTAQMNLPYIAAVVLADGEAFVEQFTPERIADPGLAELASRVRVSAAADIDARGDGSRHATRIAVTLRDGRRLSEARDFAHGSTRDPMTRTEVVEKFRRLAGTALPPQRVADLEREIMNVEAAPSLLSLARLLAGTS
jgi:aconitate decarboxylase